MDMTDNDAFSPGADTNGSLASDPLPKATSPRYLNNGYQEDGDHEQQTEKQPSSARRLPPLELEPSKPARHKSKSPRVTRQQNVDGEETNDVASPRRYKKKRSKNRPTSAESGTSLNTPDITNASKFGTSPMSSPRGFSKSINDAEVSVRPKDPNRQIKVVAEIERPTNEVVVQDRPVVRSRSFVNDTRVLYPPSLQGSIGKSHSSSALHRMDNKELAEDTVDLVSTDLSASFTKAPSHSILKYSPDSGSHVVDMFRAGSRPNSASSNKPSVRIDDQVTYSDEPVLSTNQNVHKTLRPKSAKKDRPKSPVKSHTNGMANGVNYQRPLSSRFRLTTTTQRKISPHIKTSIFTMIFCGFFAGAVALFFSLRTRKSLKEGDEEQAKKDSFYSKLANGIGICSALLITTIVVIYYNIYLTNANKSS